MRRWLGPLGIALCVGLGAPATAQAVFFSAAPTIAQPAATASSTTSKTTSWEGWGPPETTQAPPAPSRPVPNIGDLVRHSTFGEGMVMDCIPSAGDHEVTVHFKGAVGIKRLLLSFAPLEIVEE